MDGNSKGRCVCCSVDDPKHCLKYPSKVCVQIPFQVHRNLVHPKGLYSNEQPTAYVKHWGKNREHLLIPKRLQRWALSEETPWTSWQGASLGDYQWLPIPVAPGCCVISVLFSIWLHLRRTTWWGARSWKAGQHIRSLPDPISESGSCNSVALPVHLGLKDKASALPPLHSGSCTVWHGLTRGLWESPAKFEFYPEWLGGPEAP